MVPYASLCSINTRGVLEIDTAPLLVVALFFNPSKSNGDQLGRLGAGLVLRSIRSLRFYTSIWPRKSFVRARESASTIAWASNMAFY